MKNIVEEGIGIREGIKDFKFNASNVTAFITASVFGISGAFILFANVAANANMTDQQAVSWIMSGTVLGAVVTIFLGLYYKQPIVILPSLPALLVMGPMFSKFELEEMVAGYLVAGIIIFLIGAFGIIGKIGRILPIPIIMGMIAGVFMSYGLKMVEGVGKQPLVGGLMIGAFLLAHILLKKVPPLLVALIVGIVSTFLLIPFTINSTLFKIYLPVIIMPEFNPSIIMSVSIPLVLLVLADTLKGYGVLRANNYQTPLDKNTVVAGLVSVVASFFLSHPVSMAGPVTAIVGGKEAGPAKYRYVASVLNAVVMLMAGIMAGFVLPFIKSLPSDISHIIAGLAMLGLFTSSLEMAFGSRKYLKGAFTAFIVGLSGFSVWSIGAPVWAILFGIIVSIFTERQDFQVED